MNDTEITQAAQANTAALAMIKGLTLVTADDLAFATEVLVSVKTKWRELEDHRTSATKPLNQSLRQINAWFSPAQEPLKEAECVLKHAIAQYHIVLAANNAEAMRRASARALLGDGRGASSALETMQTVVATPGVSVREKWAYEVEDEALVPRHLLSVDHAKIRAQIALADTATPPVPIAGVRIYRTGQVTVRT